MTFITPPRNQNRKGTNIASIMTEHISCNWLSLFLLWFVIQAGRVILLVYFLMAGVGPSSLWWPLCFRCIAFNHLHDGHMTYKSQELCLGTSAAHLPQLGILENTFILDLSSSISKERMRLLQTSAKHPRTASYKMLG